MSEQVIDFQAEPSLMDLVRTAIRVRGFTNNELSRKAKWARGMVTGFMRGGGMRMETLERVLKVLGMKLMLVRDEHFIGIFPSQDKVIDTHPMPTRPFRTESKRSKQLARLASGQNRHAPACHW